MTSYAGRSGDGILEIEQSAGGKTVAPGQSHQVVDVKVAQNQCRGRDQHPASEPLPTPCVVPAGAVLGRAAEDGRHVPVGKEQSLVQQPSDIVGWQSGRQRHRRLQPMQVNKHVDGQPVECRLVVPGANRRVKVSSPKSSSSNSPAGFVAREDARRAETQTQQMPSHANERPYVFSIRRARP